MSILFNNIYTPYNVDNRPLVDLYGWAQATYPDTYQSMTELDQIGKDYLNSVRGTYMGNMFFNCKSLTILNTSKWDTSNVTSMSYMFYGCRALTSLDLSTWETSNVVSMDYMFSICTSLVSLDISKWSTPGSIGMTMMFIQCSSLRYLIIESLTFKFQMYDSNCGNLNNTCKILVPSSLISTYQNATNWSSRASQFDAIENYTITRSNGQVTVTPNS